VTTDNEKQLPEQPELPENWENEAVEEDIMIVSIGVRPGFMLRKVGQAYMVMPTGPRMKEYEGMITLNETGAFLFKESQKPDVSKEKLIAACISEYDASEEEAERAVDMFIMQCGSCGIFEKKIVRARFIEKKKEGTDDEPTS